MIDRTLILDSFQGVRNHTIQAAKDIPADKYDWKPAGEGTLTVAEVLSNIIRVTEFMTSLATGPEIADFASKPREEWFRLLTWTNRDALKTPEQFASALEKSFAEIRRRVEAADPAFLDTKFRAPDGITKVRLYVVQNAKEQEMTNRATLFLYERMLGIVPHLARPKK